MYMPVNMGLLVSTPEANATKFITSFNVTGSIDNPFASFGNVGRLGKSFELFPLNLDFVVFELIIRISSFVCASNVPGDRFDIKSFSNLAGTVIDPFSSMEAPT